MNNGAVCGRVERHLLVRKQRIATVFVHSGAFEGFKEDTNDANNVLQPIT